ncbi:hypothetical protein M0657_011993 [Pyricularia oryzae]|nr:hypothetical protein M0657_011993 [Pyricularia oryzae]KAI7910502.1 hypothetical protein M9X92_011064 [Pyricularia oryzae]
MMPPQPTGTAWFAKLFAAHRSHDMLDVTFSASVSVQMLLAFLVLVLIGARFYLKLGIQRKSLEATDYLIFAAWLCAVASTSADIAMLHVNMPFDTLASFANYEPDRPETFVFILKYLFGVVFVFYLGYYLCKFAILSVYLQLFPRHMKGIRYALYGTIGCNVGAFMASILIILLSCVPVPRNWSLDPNDACPMNIAISDALWAIHIGSSIMSKLCLGSAAEVDPETNYNKVYVLPFLIMRGMQMKRPVKIGLYITFGLGGIDLVASSLMRFVWFRPGADDLRIANLDLYYAIDNYIFLTVACLPSLRPYLGMMKSTGGSARSSRQTKSSEGSSAASKPQELSLRNSHPWRQQPSQLSPISPKAPVTRLGSMDTLEGRRADVYDHELEEMPRGGVATSPV